MPSYLSPGVYVEEVDKGTKPIESVGTAVAAFVGYTERASDVQNGQTVSLLGKPTLVTNWSQYVQKFGGFVDGIYLPDAVYGYFANGGGRCYIVSVKTLGGSTDPAMASPAEVTIKSADEKAVPLLTFSAKEAGPTGNVIRTEIKPGDAPQTFTLNISVGGEVKESFENLTIGKGERDVASVLKTQSKLLNVKVTATKVDAKSELAPAPGIYNLVGGDMKKTSVTLKDYQGSTAERRGLGGLEPLDDVTMICVPDLMSSYQAGEMDLRGVQAVQQAVIDYCERVKYCFAILDAPPGLMPQQVKEWRMQVNYDTTRAALYYPWIETADMTGANGRTRTVPPSGHIAGIYARTDETRGVHKAPANEVVRGALGLEVQVTKGEQDMLNPIGVNCVRPFPGRGIRVWGARTLSSDPSWRYINVRRLFNMIEESIERGTQWVVFEPNDSNLWARVSRDISAFLKLVWRSGALFGTTPEQAFYVKCDEETNPPEVRDVGQLIVEVGLSPVKPAEFVIFRISQWAGPNAEG
ncbi:MAG: phage tail sheath family protein [Chloroflexi bacterium]|nr:phage tail sheath family protein [Chloroflexota bacterium]